MLCKNCNNQIPNDSVICPNCSAPTGVNAEISGGLICPFCGAAISGEHKFCISCGNKIQHTNVVERTLIEPDDRKYKKKKSNGVLIATIISLCVIVIALVVYIIIQGNANDSGNYYYVSDSDDNSTNEEEESEKETEEEIEAETDEENREETGEETDEENGEEIDNIIALEVDDYDDEVSSDSYTISGTASSTKIDSVLTVNGEKIITVPAGEGEIAWDKTLHLDEGINKFTIILSDSEGKRKTKVISINNLSQEDEFLFQSDRVYITESDLEGKSQFEVALIRNEIYARHGYVFSTPEYEEYFSQKSWYVPNPDFSESLLNDIEKANKDFLVQYETDRGWR